MTLTERAPLYKAAKSLEVYFRRTGDAPRADCAAALRAELLSKPLPETMSKSMVERMHVDAAVRELDS